MNETVLILDFGGQYKELLARSARRLNVYSCIKSGALPLEEIRKINPVGIILTGGPNSVYAKNAPACDPRIFAAGIPILGVCYGMQLMCHALGGVIARGAAGEYGITEADLSPRSLLFKGLPGRARVLMSHADRVEKLPDGFSATAASAHCATAACENPEKKLYAVQFHPETESTERGEEIIKNFLYGACGARGDYNIDDYLKTESEKVRARVGRAKILLALSGGVDSSVAAALLSRAAPGQLTCVFVDHGFMRKNEGDAVERAFRGRDLNFVRVNAAERFINKVKGVTDPEEKRKLIGAEFAAVFSDEAEKIGADYLAQGTIYPDVVESGGESTAVIKSHHNVGGLPKDLKFKGVIEPLSGLFKDEVRVLGKKLGLPPPLVNRQPFPGPGLAIRIMGEVTAEKLEILREADAIFCEEVEKTRGKKPDQYFAVFTGAKSVGVKGDGRAYEYVIAVRAVRTSDFMTCEYSPLPHRLLGRAASRIANEVKGAGRVVYDVTGKPPATVEWE